MKVRKITLSSLLVAIGVISGHIINIPIGSAKIFPVQHGINLLMGVLFGPWWGVAVAFIISLLRNILGTGSILAFPGSMIGAFLAGFLYQKTKKESAALIGEVFGTGIIGAIVSYPIASYFLGKEVTLYFFVIPFILSSLVGALAGYVLLKMILKTKIIDNYNANLD